METSWNERYSSEEYVYGVSPNLFFKSVFDPIEPGKILLPAEGEGRNAVYAASKGWGAYAFDSSSIAYEKALKLCKSKNLNINYKVCSYDDVKYDEESFDFIAFVFAHNSDRQNNHRHLLKFLKPGGTIVLEAFSKEQIEYRTGGPPNLDLLYSIEELQNDFSELGEIKVWIEEIVLNEGPFHKGKASVIRLIGKK